MRGARWFVLLALGPMVAAGCSTKQYTRPERYQEGLVVCLSGAGGMTGEVDRIRQGLDEGGVGYALESFQWSRGTVLGDQWDVSENRAAAGRVARRVEAYLRQYPGRPVWLIGVSAGTGIAVWAVEDLGPGYEAEGAVLLASSLDSHYDLSAALRKVRCKIYSFHSPLDTVLAVGVPLAGTVDREGAVSGGLTGFSPPEGASAATKDLYSEKLEQIGWTPADVLLGNLGDHLGGTQPGFVRERVAPLVLWCAKTLGQGEPTPPAAGASKGDAKR